MGGGLSKKKFSKEEKMLKQVRQQNELRDKWLSRIENTSCVLSEVGSELDGRYSIEVFFSEFFAHEHLLCPRRLLLIEDPEGITSEAKRLQMRSKIPGKVVLHWPESSTPVKNLDKEGIWRKSYGYSTCRMEDVVIAGDQFQDMIVKCGICSASNLKARDDLQEEFNHVAETVREMIAQRERLEAEDGSGEKRKKKAEFDPDNPEGSEDYVGVAPPKKYVPKISMRNFVEIFAKWRMSQYTEWKSKDRKEFGKMTVGELLLRLRREWRERFGLITKTSFIAFISEDRWLMSRDPLEEALTDLECLDLRVLLDNVKVTYKAEQDQRASQALTFVPWMRDYSEALITRARAR